jgi:hypothetical protein
MTTPLYTIERWPHGWTISAAPTESDVPFHALDESLKLFPKGFILDNAIAGHLRRHRRMFAVFVIGTAADLAVWRGDILADLAHLPRGERWWKGLDVGTSSAAIFAVFSNLHREAARDLSRGSVPHDADDFGRCKRLLELFPEWLANLDRVAIAYPSTPWPSLVDRWQDLTAAHGSADFQPLLDSLIH